jgi:hypothetical protein
LHQETEYSKSADVTRTNQIPGKLIETGKTKPHRHSYLVKTILLAIKFLISGLNSCRGIAKTFEILFSVEKANSTTERLSQQSPKFNTIRQWVLRLGLYELNRTKEYRTDWIFILDLTIEIGKTKCLVILGIPQEKLEVIVKQAARSLHHQDVEVLSIEILNTTVRVVILEKLNNLAEQVGDPIQIVSDRGSDIKKGIDLYIENHPTTIATYDITHRANNRSLLMLDDKFLLCRLASLIFPHHLLNRQPVHNNRSRLAMLLLCIWLIIVSLLPRSGSGQTE